jgi:hypothetical protein
MLRTADEVKRGRGEAARMNGGSARRDEDEGADGD